MSHIPELGKLIEGKAFRDCVHVAVAPASAGEDLDPGQWVMLRDGLAVAVTAGDPRAAGVVDPFLFGFVEEGERFWLLLKPGLVTSLRHAWTAPGFEARVPGGEGG